MDSLSTVVCINKEQMSYYFYLVPPEQSRHTIVSHAAQEAGQPHHGYIDRKKENIIFTPLYLGDTLSDWNQICCRTAHQLRESTFQM